MTLNILLVGLLIPCYLSVAECPSVQKTITCQKRVKARLDAPVILPADGYRLKTPYVRVVIQPPASARDAVVRYTIDGREPTAASPVFSGFNAHATTTVKAKAFKPGFAPSRTAVCRIIRRAETLAEAMDVAAWNVTTDAAAPWTVTWEAESFDGQSAVRSAPLKDSPTWDRPVTSAVRATVRGKGTLAFRWKVSCEKSPCPSEPYDHLALCVDGVRVATLDGKTGWIARKQVIETDDDHTIEWVYSKDGYGSDGQDCGWIDTVSWTPSAPSNVAPKITCASVRLWKGGPAWATCNFGAERPEEAGVYLRWTGRETFDPIQAQQKEWRTPQEKDYQALIDNSNAEWTTLHGVPGIRFTGKGQFKRKSVFFPAAGEKSGSEEPGGVGLFGNYWTSESDAETPAAARYLSINPKAPVCHCHFKYFACLIRPIKVEVSESRIHAGKGPKSVCPSSTREDRPVVNE